MKKIHIVGLAVFAALAMSAIAASSALAVTSTWLVSGAVSAVQQHALLTGKLTLEDTKAGPSGEPVTVECEVTGEEALGFVGPGGEDLQETGECLAAKFVTGLNGPCEVAMTPEVTPDNLPWLTSIELLGNNFYDNIVTELSGQTEIGWTVSNCLVLGLNISDLCSVTLGRAALSNNVGGTVDVLFNSADVLQPHANCTRGGAGNGRVDGLLTAEALEGLTLAVSEG